MRGSRTAGLLLVVVGLVVGASSADAQGTTPVPALRARVNDAAGMLSGAEAQALERKLEAYERATQHQFALLTVRTLGGESIEQFGIRVADAWKLGDAKRDDGLIVILAKEEHDVRIEVGYGLEGVIPDAIAARVIRETMAPAFKAGRFAEGINAGFDALMNAASPGAAPTAVKGANSIRKQKSPWFVVLLQGLCRFAGVLLFLFFAIFMRLGAGGRRYGRRRPGHIGYWGGGFGGGGFGGGGFGGGGFGGGGGGFGGGGASGKW
ncbi:MAG: TPM domain-containing protein [Polyangiales bacterium]